MVLCTCVVHVRHRLGVNSDYQAITDFSRKSALSLFLENTDEDTSHGHGGLVNRFRETGLVKDQEARIWQTISGFIGSRVGNHLSTSLYHIFSADLFPTCIDLLDRKIPRLRGTVNYVGFTLPPSAPRCVPERKGIDYPFRWSFQWVAKKTSYKSFGLVNRCKFSDFFCFNGHMMMVKEEFVFSGHGGGILCDCEKMRLKIGDETKPIEIAH